MRPINEFSEAYYLVNADIVEYNGQKVAVDEELLRRIRQHSKVPFLKIDGEHFLAGQEWGIPSRTVAVPDYANAESGGPVLLAKDEQAKHLLQTGSWREGTLEEQA